MPIGEHRIISGDTHMELDSRWWINRMPEEYQNRAPRVLKLPDGGIAWLVEGAPLITNAILLYGGKGRSEWVPFGQSYENRLGTESAEQRLEEQDMDGIFAEVLFPGVAGPALWRNIKDDAPYLAFIRAYNSFLAEEYCPVNPDRLLGVGVIPQSGVDDAIAEMEYCHDAGLRAVVLGMFPNGGRLPSDEDDRFWEKSLELNMPVTIHENIKCDRAQGILNYPNADPDILKRIGTRGRFAESTVKMARDPGVNAIQLTLSGLFDRFPELQVFIAETQIGWIPTFLECADQRYEKHLGWATKLLGYEPLKNGLPSDYIKRHFLWGFQLDRPGVDHRHWIGVDKVIWANDFPHQETEWPFSNGVLHKNFDAVPEEETRLMTNQNIAKFMHLADVY